MYTRIFAYLGSPDKQVFGQKYLKNKRKKNAHQIQDYNVHAHSTMYNPGLIEKGDMIQ